ncbi:unknown [Parabacteroides sp. CAG:409]|nr:unknown [Parabacteroides sp. CAG:409]
MIGTKLYIGWENHLIMFITVYGNIRPIQHRLDHLRRVCHHDLGFHPRTVRIHRNAHRPFQAMAQFRLAHPDRLAAIRIFLHLPVGRQIRRCPVMVRNIPFHTARQPGAQHTDQSRFHTGLCIKEMIIIGFVGRRENTTAYFRQDRDIHILISQPQHIILLIDHILGQYIIQRIRINVTFRSLINTSGKKDGIHFRTSDLIGRNFFFHGFHFHLLSPGRKRKHCQQGQN